MQLSQIAITSVSTQQKDVVEALDAYTKAGFRNVELALPLLKSWLVEGHTVDDAKHLLAARNMRCIGGFENIVNCFGSPEDMQQNHEMHVNNARLLHQLGGRTMVVGTDGPSIPSFEAIEVISTTLHQLARRLEGLDVSLKNCGGFLRQRLHDYAIIAWCRSAYSHNANRVRSGGTARVYPDV
jgi:4-hydroxyphenylpyruvate dioxygenase